VSLLLEIPESIAASLKLPEAEIEPRLRLELAIALYVQGILSGGKASELAKVSRYSFAEELGRRDIPRHYTGADLEADLKYANG
jgi:predicted HTH domain antitoxin